MLNRLRDLPFWFLLLALAMGGCATRALGPGPADQEVTENGPGEAAACAATAGTAEEGENNIPEAEAFETTGDEEIHVQSDEAEDVSFLADLDKAAPPEDSSALLPVESNDRVEFFIKLFQGPQRRWMERALRRSGRYAGKMREILREEGLPEELVYLALIESGFNPYAYSSARAMGIWQFIPSTARRHGLVINWWIDERRDLEKSTRAAAKYLKDLYGLFDDWYLAAAAYNAGEGRLQKAIRRVESNCFWDISRHRYLKKETKNYVPRFLAALMIAEHPEKYGFADVHPDPPLLYETVTVPDATDLAVIAKGCGASLSLLRKLNPQLQRGCTPPNYPDYEVKIPLGTKAAFQRYYAKLPPSKRLTFRRHRIKRGETLSQIALHYGISVRSIMAMNHLKNRHRIREGKSLIIPLPASYRVARHRPRKRHPVRLPDYSARGYRKVVHVVENGESLWLIGRRYGVSVASLRKWNRKRGSSRIYPGQEIVVWLKEPSAEKKPAPRPPVREARADQQEIWYVVQPGDTLWEIARRYGVTISQLSRWNRIDARRPIRPGLRLRIYKGIRLNAELHAASSGPLRD